MTVQVKITSGFRVLLPSSILSQSELDARNEKKKKNPFLDIESNSMQNICCHLCIHKVLCDGFLQKGKEARW